ncbi:hypothetical protein AC481_02420 [miscellaneous Crenarchaeota group archaeon SMTZ-80]|nr:MAG: hypothetical protein AC481_02420 [miscellaneous Crenarchaeota group archaeon SMTZ-80]
MKEYKQGTFDKRVAYGQRTRKLLLVSSGIIDGFQVRCKTEKKAENLAYAFRIRKSHVEKSERAKYSLRIKVDGKTVYVTQKEEIKN